MFFSAFSDYDKLKAKKEKRIVNSDIKVACQHRLARNAINFGNAKAMKTSSITKQGWKIRTVSLCLGATTALPMLNPIWRKVHNMEKWI
jgi:hypothetical protein